MSKISKLEPVTLVYENGRIKVEGATVKASLVITLDQLKAMYFGGTGHGTVNLKIEETEGSNG